MKAVFLRMLSLLLAVLTIVALLPAADVAVPAQALADSEKYPGYMGVAYTAADVKKIVEDYYNTVTNGGKKTAYWNRDIRNDPRNSNSITQLKKDTGLSAPKGVNSCTWYMQRVPYLRTVSNKVCGSTCTSNGFKGVGTEQPHNSKGQQTDWQCQGFAAYMAFVVFGERTYEYSTPIYGADAKNVEIMVGDVVRIQGSQKKNGTYNGHSMFVYDVYTSGGKTYAKTIECNWTNACCKIHLKEREVSTLKSYIKQTGGEYFICQSPLRHTSWGTNVEVKLNSNSNGYNLYAEPSTSSATVTTTLIPKGTAGIATKIQKNSAGHYWYYITINGLSGWIYGGNCDVVAAAPGVVTVSNLTNLSAYKVSTGSVNLIDKLSAKNCTIKKVVGAIRTSSGAVAKNNESTSQGSTVDIICRSYAVEDGPINSKLTPKKMAAGLYRYTLDVDVSVKVTDGTSLSDRKFTNIRVLDDWFETYKSSGSSIKITLDANGGSCVQKEQLAYKSKAIGALPVPTNVGSTFLGWYTAKTGGTKVTDSSTVTSATTLYAQWDKVVAQHVEVTVPGKAATCTATGLTEGKKCSICGTVLVAQQVIPVTDHSWNAATCTAPKTCSTCGTTQGNALNHTEVTTSGKAATCTATGLTEGKKCSVCGTVLVEQTAIAALGHDKISHAAKAATCTQKGYQAYETCSRCDYSTYKETAPTGHTYSNVLDGSCNACGIDRATVESRTVVHMFRMYNPNTGEHFYTGSEVERDNLISHGWQYEGIGFTFPANIGTPVHRLFQSSTGEHLYTMDVAEKDRLIAQGWNYEGIAFNSAFDTEAVQHRLHNPNATVGAYHFTFSTQERDTLIAAGWEYQGIGWYSCWK